MYWLLPPLLAHTHWIFINSISKSRQYNWNFCGIFIFLLKKDKPSPQLILSLYSEYFLVHSFRCWIAYFTLVSPCPHKYFNRLHWASHSDFDFSFCTEILRFSTLILVSSFVSSWCKCSWLLHMRLVHGHSPSCSDLKLIWLTLNRVAIHRFA